ncbi:MAG: hypothetical protein ACSHYF_06165 [Verrucomicrobiaceae bacterium]
MRLLFLILLLALPAPGQIRIDAQSFDVPATEVRAIIDATISVFPKADLPPLFITNSPKGPLTLFDRSPRGEFIIHLNVRQRYWCQYIYQFAHELTHVRAGFRNDATDNKWLEETLCETASLFALRQLSLKWRDHPHWKSYRHQLHTYAQNIIATREKITPETLPAYLQQNLPALRKDPTLRAKNGAIANILLPHFQIDPNHWLALTTLNKNPAPPGQTLSAFLLKWHNDSPSKHQPFILHLTTLLN